MEDLIDFLCSPDWLDYYHERGLTPRKSGRPDPTVEALLRELVELKKQSVATQQFIIELLKEIKELKSEVRSARRSKPKPDPVVSETDDIEIKGGIYG